MNAAEILVAVEKAGATLRVDGNSLVASNASRIAPAIKAAIRDRTPERISALLAPPESRCRVTIVEIPATGLRYRRTFAHLQLKPSARIDVARRQQCVEDGKRFLAKWAHKPKRSAGRGRTCSG